MGKSEFKCLLRPKKSGHLCSAARTTDGGKILTLEAANERFQLISLL